MLNIEDQLSAALIAGAFLTAGLFNAILFFGFNRQRTYLYLGLLCLASAAKALILLYAPLSETDDYSAEIEEDSENT